MEKVQETDKKVNPETMMKPEEEKPNAACVSALDMILKSLRKTKAFLSDVMLNFCEETHKSFTENYLSQLQDHFLSNISHIRPDLEEEENGVAKILVTILELQPRWNKDFEVYEVSKENCDRCITDTEYPPERSYGILINANSLRETKYEFENFSFENILKIIRVSLKMPCNKEVCENQSYVHRVIKKLPSVFTIALEWEKNETREEILNTVSVLKTEIDISAIYDSENGWTPNTKYTLVSMVCSYGYGYIYIANENNRWVTQFGIAEVVIGDWDRVLDTFSMYNIRPEILFFENAMNRAMIVTKQRVSKSVLDSNFAERFSFVNHWLSLD